MSADHFDIVIAGAGMVGSTAALALSRNGFRVALVEARPAPVDAGIEKADYDLRVSAISPRSRELLERLGVWSRLDATRICYYETMQIWQQQGNSTVAFDAIDLARDNLGAIIENRLLLQGLIGACQQQSQIEFMQPDSIEAVLENGSQAVELRLSSGRYVSASLLIAADGRNSVTRELAGIAIHSGNFQQTAIVANVDTELPHRNMAMQRFLQTGPLAFLPLANGQSSIVWSCDNDVVGDLIDADDAEFCQRLAAAFDAKLGQVTSCGARASFALGWHCCEHWLKNRVLVIGDAAHSVHPLAGQGVNLGFSDVELLMDMITAPAQLAVARWLRRFERQRKSETWIAGTSFHLLKRIYGMDQPGMVSLRDIGMRCIDQTPWLKRAVMQKAIRNLA